MLYGPQLNLITVLAEESDRVNVFNCYPLQSFCNNNKQMKLQLSRQQQHEPPLRHQDSDL